MPQNTPRLESNTFYHIYNRGNNKENIFVENEYYKSFIFIHRNIRKRIELM
jgi:hypothetical protein